MKRALLVGIDTYDNFSSLAGCVSDVNAIKPLLARNEDDSPNFECQSFTSDVDRVGRDDLLEAVDRLLSGGAQQALFYFAGHGAETASDVTLVLQDGTDRSPGLALSEMLGIVRGSPVDEVVIVLDCCFSGGAGRSPQLGESNAVIRNGVTIISASRPDETAAETPAGRGAFSTYLEGALEGGAADVLGKVTLAGGYAYLSESFGAWEQRPTLKTNIERAIELRACSPAVPLPQLRELVKLFPTPGYDFPLDRSYEPEEEPHDAEHERVFAVLQRCRAAKLVVPVGADHLYFAAMEGQSCRLTPLGRHYRFMAERGWL
jgi:uncharacterized caspase-like protein